MTRLYVSVHVTTAAVHSSRYATTHPAVTVPVGPRSHTTLPHDGETDVFKSAAEPTGRYEPRDDPRVPGV